MAEEIAGGILLAMVIFFGAPFILLAGGIVLCALVVILLIAFGFYCLERWPQETLIAVMAILVLEALWYTIWVLPQKIREAGGLFLSMRGYLLQYRPEFTVNLKAKKNTALSVHAQMVRDTVEHRQKELNRTYFSTLCNHVKKLQKRYRRHPYIQFVYEKDYINIKIHPQEITFKIFVSLNYPTSQNPTYICEGRGGEWGYGKKDFEDPSTLKKCLQEELNNYLRMEKKKDSLLSILGQMALIAGGVILLFFLFKESLIELDWIHLHEYLTSGLEKVRNFYLM